ncbi:MAG: heavy-metal-associated domain-containing protein [bacterium]
MKLKVEGMTCQGCVKSVTKVIAKQTQADEATVSVSLETKIAEFQADEAQICPSSLHWRRPDSRRARVTSRNGRSDRVCIQAVSGSLKCRGLSGLVILEQHDLQLIVDFVGRLPDQHGEHDVG